MTTILLLLLCGVALVGGLAWLLAPLVRSRSQWDDHHSNHRRVRRLALLAQAGRSYHRPTPNH